MRHSNRGADALRAVSLTPGFSRHAEGSCLVKFGDTHVLVTASLEEKAPPFLKGSGKGWVTAEYGMLPRSTHDRMRREAAAGKQSGRTQEIQRLVGRSLRAAVDLSKLGPRTLTIDCDVLEADGGTRTASISGGFVALALALAKVKAIGVLREPVAAISVGLVKGLGHALDLCYVEDSKAEVDLNVVATASGKIVEIQGTAEGEPVERKEIDRMVDMGLAGIATLAAQQRAVLAAAGVSLDALMGK